MPYSGSPAERRIKQREAYHRNPEHRRALKRAWDAANRVKARKSGARSQFRKRYKVELDLKAQWLKAQGGVCTICKTDAPGKRDWHFDADHTHYPPFLRGVLCGRCNRAIGLLRHDISVIRAAAQYLCERAQ
jgi:hypothetical protein